jgi:hypothetical protein
MLRLKHVLAGPWFRAQPSRTRPPQKIQNPGSDHADLPRPSGHFSAYCYLAEPPLTSGVSAAKLRRVSNLELPFGRPFSACPARGLHSLRQTFPTCCAIHSTIRQAGSHMIGHDCDQGQRYALEIASLNISFHKV